MSFLTISSCVCILLDVLNYHFNPTDDLEGSEMKGFLEVNKNRVDADPEALPFDDLRNYAYEGDGNSVGVGSLSSLASGTDDDDTNFDFLPNFGPRFKKLADMYGEDSSDDERSSRPSDTWR